MHGDVHTVDENTPFPRRTGTEGDRQARGSREPVVRAAALKAAIAQLRDIVEADDRRSGRQSLVANLMLLRALGVDDEALDLVMQMVLAHNVDEEMTTAINYLASGFLLALLTFREEGSIGTPCSA
jgi:hypothetical protein